MAVLGKHQNVSRYFVNIKKPSGNMNCSEESVPVARPGTARVTVTELAASSHTNPTPASQEDVELLLELTLTPEVLKDLTGCTDLRKVTTLEMTVNTQEHSLGNLGVYLPNLVQLKLSNSLITSVRDLGTTLSHLKVLWMPCCDLPDLDGISSFSSLKELYVAYNNIADLSQVSMLVHLELLDVEGNNINDLVQVQYLGLCSQLRSLTLEGNPVCVRPHPGSEQLALYCYRSAVKEMVPQLRFLDDISVENTAASCVSLSLEDWALLKDSIKDSVSDSLVMTEVNVAGRPVSSRPRSAARPLNRFTSRPCSAVRPPSRSASRLGTVTSISPVDPDTSDLTCGMGQVVCGNPVQALRARRQNMRLPASPSCSTPNSRREHRVELTFDLEGKDGKHNDEDDGSCTDVFAELTAWRVEHSRRLIAIERDRLPQVMKVHHSDTGQEEEEEGDGSSLSSLSEEENEEEEQAGVYSCHHGNTDSSDSCFQSPAPDVSRSSTGSDSGTSPSPPLIPYPPKSACRRSSEMRVHRCLLKVPDPEMVKKVSIGETVLATRPRTHPALTSCDAPCQRPTSSPAVLKHRRLCNKAEGRFEDSPN